MRWLGWFGGVLLCVASAGACSGSTRTASCASDGDCKGNQRCEQSVCTSPGSKAERDGGVGSGARDAGAGADSGAGTGNSPGNGRGGSGASNDPGSSTGASDNPGGRIGAGGAQSILATGGAPPNRPDPSSFDHVDAATDFTHPVTVPPPDTSFSGDASGLVGSWIELNYDGKPCTPESSGDDISGTVCTHLEIRATNGGYSGTIYREISGLNTPNVQGPFAPAQDPTRGYPVELIPKQYGYARDFTPAVNYRMFDGLVRSGYFSFWVSPLDLWSEWCGMQTAYPWNISGKQRYRCVPQSATEKNTDDGKLALCTSAEDLPTCKDTYGNVYPCVCLDDTGQFNSAEPLCSLTYCECSAAECHADLRGTAVTSVLSVNGDTMTGTIAFDTYFAQDITLQKVAP
jgi:hypothetical protein